MKFFNSMMLVFMLTVSGSGQILYESGDLMEFIGGTSVTTAYDNYVSHISEGIVDPGYNDYGPAWLDPQTDGFGDYRILSSGGSSLAYWREIFQRLIRMDTLSVAQMLADSVESFRYDLVRFQDTTESKTYWMLRERLDESYVDTSLTSDPSDDVVGSFRNGWGLYIFNPNAIRDFALVEVPHPNDDFIAPYNGLALFRQIDAGVFMLAGAGREVKWDGIGDYSNNSSLSDPARNSNTVFQVFHEVLCDSLLNSAEPHAPLVLHSHSFDNNDAHENYKSIVLSGGWDAGYANKPIRDVTDAHLDFVNFTAEYPISAGQFGFHGSVRVDNYYQVHYDGVFNYYGAFDQYAMPHTYYLLGPITGVQMNYLRQFIPGWSVYEPWVQIEMDEKPQLFDDLNMTLDSLYNRPVMPRGWRNYTKILAYYQPFRDAVENYLTHWESEPDTIAPATPSNFRATFISDTFMALAWDPVEDTNFKTYRIYYDDESISSESPSWDVNQDVHLSDMRENATIIDNLPSLTPLNFRITALDHLGNESPLSDSLLNYIPDLETPDIFHRELEEFPREDWPPRVMLENTSIIDFDSVWVEAFDGDGDFLGHSDLEPYSWTRWIGTLEIPDAQITFLDTVFYQIKLKEITGINAPFTYPDSGYFVCLPAGEPRDWLDTDLEENDSGFESSYVLGTTRWQWGTPQTAAPSAHSGTKVWGTNLLSNYASYSYTRLTTPPIDLNGYGFQYLSFYHWYELESSSAYPTRAYDGGNIRISTDEGETWERISPVGGYTHTINAQTNLMNGEPVFSGASNGWRRVICDLSDYVNQTVMIQFQFASDANTTRLGWYLDDLQIVGEINDTPVTNVNLLQPQNGSTWGDNEVDFLWTTAQDPDVGADVRYDFLYRPDSESTWLSVSRLREPSMSLDLRDTDWNFTQMLNLDWTIRVYSQSDTLMSPDTFQLILPPRSLHPMTDFHLIHPPLDTVIMDSMENVTFRWSAVTDTDVGVENAYLLYLVTNLDTLVLPAAADTSLVVAMDTLTILERDSTGISWWVMAMNQTEYTLADTAFHFFLEHYVSLAYEALPTSYELSPAYPNPFNPATNFTVAVPEVGQIKLELYDILGRRVRTLLDDIHQPGYYTVKWNGLTDQGQQVASGLYLVRMVAPGFHQTQKILLLR